MDTSDNDSQNIQIAPQDEKENNNWTTTLEEDAVLLGESAGSYKWIHDEAYRQHSVENDKHARNIKRCLILSAALTGLGGIGVFTDLSNWQEVPIKLVNGLLIWIASILTLYTTMEDDSKVRLQSEEKDRHKKSSYGYFKVYHSIKGQLTVSRHKREDGIIYIRQIRKLMVKLYKHSPLIDDSVRNSFETNIKGKDLVNPGEIKRINLINNDNIVTPSVDFNNIVQTYDVTSTHEIGETEEIEQINRIIPLDPRSKYIIDRYMQYN
jgi:hypothetical protein